MSHPFLDLNMQFTILSAPLSPSELRDTGPHKGHLHLQEFPHRDLEAADMSSFQKFTDSFRRANVVTASSLFLCMFHHWLNPVSWETDLGRG